jgi:hypothetical protein
MYWFCRVLPHRPLLIYPAIASYFRSACLFSYLVWSYIFVYLFCRTVLSNQNLFSLHSLVLFFPILSYNVRISLLYM